MGHRTNTSRRRLLKTVAAGAASWPALTVLGQAPPHSGHHGAAADAKNTTAKKEPPFRPSFFNEHEFATVSAVTERIIPTDETPGAREAKVAEFVDLMVKNQPDLHSVYRNALVWLDAQREKPFVTLAAKQQDEILRALADAKDVTPENETAVRFFKSIRALTIDGFYTSKVGLKELGYTGNTYLSEFKGCTHLEHG